MQWLEAFDIPEKDSFFIKWNRYLFDIGGIIKREEKKLHKELLETMWNAIYFMIYLHYDTEKEFILQFEENAKHLMNILELLPTEM